MPYIGKIDDDTAPNLAPLSALLASLRCRPHVLVGAINWAGVIPSAHDTGVRAPLSTALGLVARPIHPLIFGDTWHGLLTYYPW